MRWPDALLPARAWEASRAVLYEPFKLGHFRAREFAAAGLFALAVVAVLAASAAFLVGLPRPYWAPVWLPAAVHALAAGGLSCVAWGVLVEPYQLSLLRVRVESAKVRAPLRLLQLSDLHVRSWSRVEDSLLRAARELVPDLILLTGDYTAVPGSLCALHELLQGLARLAPVYAALGNTEFLRPVHRELHVEGLTWLSNDCEALTLGRSRLRVFGVRPGQERTFWQSGRNTRPGEFGVCLYHFPDFAPDVGRVPYDLLLSGHTHGGQVRLPWLGALVSLGRGGTRYAHGVFREGGRTAVVSQGVGCESYGLPRIRFLCPPEAVVIDLVPAVQGLPERR